MNDLVDVKIALNDHGKRLDHVEHILVGDVGEDGKARLGMVPRLERIENLLDESKNIMTAGIGNLVKLAGRGIWVLLVTIVTTLLHLWLGVPHAH